MPLQTTPTGTVPALVAGGLMLVLWAAPIAQRGRRGVDANTGTPIATNAILENPDAYYGKPVTISAGVEQMLSKTAFLIDQRKASGTGEVQAIGKPILVIAPYLTGPLDHKHYVLMRGEIVKFDPASTIRGAADYKLDLAPEVAAKYQGQPVLLATSVLNSTYTELARKPVPPPSAQEASFSATMKTIAPAFAALRTAVQESKMDGVVQNAAQLEPAFTRAESIWDELGQSGAAEWSREARRHTASLQAAAAAGNWEAASASAGAINQLCQSCHAAYRDRLDDGTFRGKPGLF